MLSPLAAAAILATQLAEPPTAPPRRMVTPAVPYEGRCAAVALDLSAIVPVVEVMVNGKGPYRFAIDTGAQGAGRISGDVADELGLEIAGEVRAPAPGGAFDTRKVYRADTLAVGSVTFGPADLIAAASSPGRIGEWSGVLGIDLFRELTLTIDYGNAVLRLSREAVSRGVAASFGQAVPRVPLTIGEVTATVDLDTGNVAGALFLSEELAAAVPKAGPAAERGRARTAFGEFSIMEAPIAVPVKVGEVTLPIQAVGWPPARGEGNLGSRGLTGMRVAVDHANGRVEITPSEQAPGCP